MPPTCTAQPDRRTGTSISILGMSAGQQPFMAPDCAAAQASSAQEMGANMRNTLLRHPWSVVSTLLLWSACYNRHLRLPCLVHDAGVHSASVRCNQHHPWSDGHLAASDIQPPLKSNPQTPPLPSPRGFSPNPSHTCCTDMRMAIIAVQSTPGATSITISEPLPSAACRHHSTAHHASQHTPAQWCVQSSLRLKAAAALPTRCSGTAGQLRSAAP
jgi:hypothetical protein